MDTEELLETLQAADLSYYQANAYVTLLELGTASATEVAQASDVPDARIYDVLRDLDDFGYVELYEQETFQARATDPETIVSGLTDRASALESAAAEIEERYERPTLDTQTVSIVKRFDTVLEAARTFVRDADTQVHATLTRDQFDALRGDLADARDRGVTVNVTLLARDGDEPLTDADYEGAVSVAHRLSRPAPFVLTSDLRRTAFAPNPAAVEDYGLILRNRSFTYVFFWHFLLFMWLPSTVAYEADAAGPKRYADIRQFLLENRDRIHRDEPLRVEIEGRETDSDRSVTLSGEVVDAEHVSESDGDADRAPSVMALTGTASMVVDDGEKRWTVGGWGATYEDVEANRIRVTDAPTATEAEPAE
ncbi:sugar-specific transcriptional regulator TrmB [Halorubrum trapanicum]|uniref:Sugar-specific transcriptional regulator TrmB n=1 Tax=Halorubrum trapanicum TaxID=29284 RepID=A0A8J7R651_9EURY|nr:TrmB family transcriptional regulator [Halorubrum trapanicum]MBP1900497.1 sugar-specific transcriptional regulator TrmB [Halorubrum trapanicum]